MRLHVSDDGFVMATLNETVRLHGFNDLCGLQQCRAELLDKVGTQFDKAIMDALTGTLKTDASAVPAAEAAETEGTAETEEPVKAEEVPMPVGTDVPTEYQIPRKGDSADSAGKEDTAVPENPAVPEEAQGEEAADNSGGDDVPRKGRRRIDMGKVMALRRAGWSNAEIADEMGIPAQSVANAVCAYKKKHSAPAVT